VQWIILWLEVASRTKWLLVRESYYTIACGAHLSILIMNIASFAVVRWVTDPMIDVPRVVMANGAKMPVPAGWSGVNQQYYGVRQ
jgi:hypothetical protein